MNTKSGRLEMAQKLFETLTNQSLVCWSSIITGCTQHGYGHLAPQIFNEMHDAKVKPDSYIFMHFEGLLYLERFGTWYLNSQPDARKWNSGRCSCWKYTY